MLRWQRNTSSSLGYGTVQNKARGDDDDDDSDDWEDIDDLIRVCRHVAFGLGLHGPK